MSEYIFQQDNTIKKSTSDIKYYTLDGEQDFFDDQQMPRLKTESEKVYAKQIIGSNGNIRYSIRLSLSNKLYDPTSPYGLDKTKSFLDNTVRSPDRFKSVNYKTFDLYTGFLKTKNKSYLYNAERESE